MNEFYQRGSAGDSQAKSAPRPLVTRPGKLFVVTRYYEAINFLYSEGFEKKIAMLVSYVALRTSATHAIN
jgi:hypothetical protein